MALLCVWERSHLVPRLFKIYILWYAHDKNTPCSCSPPPPLLQLQLVGPGSTSEPVTDDSGFISYRTPAKHYLPEGAITHCWTAKCSVMKQDKNTRMKHAPWPQTAHTSLIPVLTHFLCHIFWQKMPPDYIRVMLMDKKWCYPKGLKWLTICHRPVWMHQMHCGLF